MCGTSEDVLYFDTTRHRCIARPSGQYLLATLRFFKVAGHTKRMFVFEMTELFVGKVGIGFVLMKMPWVDNA